MDAPSRTCRSSKLSPGMSEDLMRSCQVESFTILSVHSARKHGESGKRELIRAFTKLSPRTSPISLRGAEFSILTKAFVVIVDAEAEIDHKVDAASRMCWSPKLKPEVSKVIHRLVRFVGRGFLYRSDIMEVPGSPPSLFESVYDVMEMSIEARALVIRSMFAERPYTTRTSFINTVRGGSNSAFSSSSFFFSCSSPRSRPRHPHQGLRRRR